MTTVTEALEAEERTDLFTVAHDLLTRAAAERKNGNPEAANKLLLAAGNIMGENIAPSEGTKGVPNGTQQVADLLRTGWKEVSEIAETTKMSPNRIHVIIGRLKGKGKGLESQSVKRYRIVESK
jgi:hypothetical protein